MWFSPFLKRHRPVLQLSQSRPRGLPVSWSWSTTIFTLTPAMLIFSQMGHCQGSPEDGACSA